MHADLDAIAHAARAVRDAEQELRARVAAAVQVATPRADYRPPYTISDVAATAGITRPTAYRWASEDGVEGGRVDVREVLAEALIMLSALIGPTNAGEVSQRSRHHDVGVMIRGLDLGLKSLDSTLTEDQQAVIQQAQSVRAAAERRREISGSWPETVII